MPHSTVRYAFEWRVRELAEELASRFGGERKPATFLMALDVDGSVLALSFEPPQDGWAEWRQRMEAGGMSHLFYDPFEAPEYTWLGWHRIPQPLMERMLQAPFQPADFVATTPGGQEEHIPYPETWGVMF